MLKNRIWLAAAVGLVCGGMAVFGQPAAAVPVADPSLGKGKVIGLDQYFNHQVKAGVQFHYIWDDTAASGYSKFGQVWKDYGATLAKLETAPKRADLDKFSVYIIVNPSTVKNAADGKPNFVQPADADVVESWVKDGGVLLLFMNDKNNTEFEHLNVLSGRFGITFNNDLRNQVPNANDRSPGTFAVNKLAPDEPLFKDLRSIYMKEISTLTLKDPAKPLLIADNEAKTGKDVIMATAKVGKGFVFAVGDPWIYNEYIDVASPGLPLDNRRAAVNLVKWILPMSSAPAK